MDFRCNTCKALATALLWTEWFSGTINAAVIGNRGTLIYFRYSALYSFIIFLCLSFLNAHLCPVCWVWHVSFAFCSFTHFFFFRSSHPLISLFLHPHLCRAAAFRQSLQSWCHEKQQGILAFWLTWRPVWFWNCGKCVRTQQVLNGVTGCKAGGQAVCGPWPPAPEGYVGGKSCIMTPVGKTSLDQCLCHSTLSMFLQSEDPLTSLYQDPHRILHSDRDHHCDRHMLENISSIKQRFTEHHEEYEGTPLLESPSSDIWVYFCVWSTLLICSCWGFFLSV